jgi:1-acyl-sn-glycerol-3-phosphate acyltransferase
MSLLYRTLRGFIRTSLSVFFRQIEVVGAEHIPEEGLCPVIFAGNHPNSLLDPALVIATSGRVVHFAAKDTLFKTAPMRALLLGLGAVPVARRDDHAGGAVDNSAMFEQLFSVLAGHRSVGIFPEGLSHDASQLAKLKTGAARIAIGAVEAHPGLPLKVIPCGLTYIHPKRFRSRVLVQYGAAIEMTEERAQALLKDPSNGMRELTVEIDRSLRELTINADDWDTLRLLDGVRRLYQPENTALEDRVELARRFNTVYPTIKHEPDIAAALDRVAQYQMRLEQLGMSDGDLRRSVSRFEVFQRLLRHTVLTFFWLPLALPGMLVHLPLATIIRFSGARLSPRKDVVATTKFVMGVLGMLFSLLAIPSVIAWRYGVLAGLAAMLGLLISGYATVRVIDRTAAVKRLLFTFAKLALLRKELQALRAERALLVSLVTETVEKYRPASMVPLFGPKGTKNH